MTNNQPGSFTFREFSKRGNVALILFVTKDMKKSFLSQRPPRRNH